MSNMWTTMEECGKEPFFIDWSNFYAKHALDSTTDLITSSIWTVTGGIKGVEFIDTPVTGVILSGGTEGSSIVAKNVIQINGGAYQDCRTITIGIV